MAKIPFDIKFRPQIESGEYKVETRDGRKARIIHWDLNCTSPIVAVMDAHIDLPGEIVDVFSVSGMAFDDLESPSDLFIITPEPELSGFEKGYMRIVHKMKPEDFNDEGLKIAKEEAAELLELAKKELCEGGEITDWYAKGKDEALRARATEITKDLDKSGLDNDSIPYHLIEFMCNLYTCQNWKEIEETAEAYVTRIKAAAMKDLPRWKKANGINERRIVLAGDNDLLCTNYAEDGEYYISIFDLEKLPKEE